MIQVTCDEYKQYYMKHDTWALSSWKKERKSRRAEMQKGSTFLSVLLF